MQIGPAMRALISSPYGRRPIQGFTTGPTRKTQRHTSILPKQKSFCPSLSPFLTNYEMIGGTEYESLKAEFMAIFAE
jgi:hypothetical protein